jgi:hypothetical protein
MYQGSWIAQSFGNDNTTGPETESAQWQVYGMPLGRLCNVWQPRCSFSKTGASVGTATSPPPLTPKQWDPRAPFCVPLDAWGLPGTRPAKGTVHGLALTHGGNTRIPPFYRNPLHFTPGGLGKTTACSAATTVLGGKATMTQLTTNDPRQGVGMKGAPVRGFGYANTTSGADPRQFTFAAHPATPTPLEVGRRGMRRTTSGSFGSYYDYNYTYATLRNGFGYFKKGGGFFATGAAPTTISFPYTKGGATVANAIVKKGVGSFGGTMRLLGQMTTKVCYFRNGGCSLGQNNWRYDAVGVGGSTSMGVLTDPYTVMYSAIYYQTVLMQTSTVMMIGSRFPWTTGSVTVTATGRGPNNTIERRQGFDNRVAGVGTVQLVSPIITKWLQPVANFEKGGIAILRIAFVPEPAGTLMLVAGLALLGMLYRARGR